MLTKYTVWNQCVVKRAKAVVGRFGRPASGVGRRARWAAAAAARGAARGSRTRARARTASAPTAPAPTAPATTRARALQTHRARYLHSFTPTYQIPTYQFLFTIITHGFLIQCSPYVVPIYGSIVRFLPRLLTSSPL